MPPRPILCLRPEPGLTDTVAKARAMGLPIKGAALFSIQPVEWTLPDALDFDGMLIGSANAIRHAGRQLQSLCGLPAYAVGAATAQIAQQAGFKIAVAGKGGLQALLDQLPSGKIRLLRLAGEDHVPLEPAPEQEIVERIVYRSAALPMPDDLRFLLEKQAIVALHSARAAEHFASECNRMGVDKGQIELAVLGPRIAKAAGSGWCRVEVAPTPDDSALLAMIQNLCK